MQKSFIYILSNKSKTLYVGVTNDLKRRMSEHKVNSIKGFTARYNINILVYFEEFSDIGYAIRREKQIKGWLRKKKIEFIEKFDPEGIDLGNDI
jgi:putative endonuclease